ncbi:MAG: hypothetical protein AB4057_00010 [Crocosphaera sp.]
MSLSFDELKSKLNLLLAWQANDSLVRNVHHLILSRPKEKWGNFEILKAYLNLNTSVFDSSKKGLAS